MTVVAWKWEYPYLCNGDREGRSVGIRGGPGPCIDLYSLLFTERPRNKKKAVESVIFLGQNLQFINSNVEAVILCQPSKT